MRKADCVGADRAHGVRTMRYAIVIMCVAFLGCESASAPPFCTDSQSDGEDAQCSLGYVALCSAPGDSGWIENDAIARCESNAPACDDGAEPFCYPRDGRNIEPPTADAGP